MFGPALNFPCHFLQPFFLTIGSTIEPVVPLMIGKIEFIGVIESDSTDRIAQMAIPANKINGISEIIPVSSPVTRVALVLLPGFVHRLGIAISRRRARAWEETKTGGTRWFCFGFEF